VGLWRSLLLGTHTPWRVSPGGAAEIVDGAFRWRVFNYVIVGGMGV